MSTTTEENVELAREYFEGVMNDNVIDETLLSEDYTAHMGTHDLVTLEEIKVNMDRSHAAFPDMAVTIEDVIATDEDVVLRWRLTGTHEGAFMGIEPTGSAVEQIGFIQFEIQDGRIYKAWVLSDTLALLQQLGVVEPLGE